MSYSNPLLTETVVATGTIAAHRAVTHAGAQVAAADARCLGFARTAGVVGELVPVDVIGTTSAESGAAITLGAQLELDNQGRVVPFATSGAIVASALQPATAAGQIIKVLIHQN